MLEKSFTANVQGNDGKSYVVYFMTETREQAENIVAQTNLITDDAGVCEMVCVYSDHVN